MSQVANQCVYAQIQKFSITAQKPRRFEEQLGIFIATRIFDVALTAAAATASVAAGARAAGVPLTPSMLQAAALGGAVKSGAMGLSGILMLGPITTPLIVIPVLLATSIGTNVLLVAAVANRLLGNVPEELLGAAAVASIPLSFCLIYYYGGFCVPITFISIAIDVLGGYTFIRMAENLGYPICSTRTAAAASAAFSAVSSVATTLLGCCIIGRSRTRYIKTSVGRGYTDAKIHASCCGVREIVHSMTEEPIDERDPFTLTLTLGKSVNITTGTVFVSFHGLGASWDTGTVNANCWWYTSNRRDHTLTQGNTSSRTVRLRRN